MAPELNSGYGVSTKCDIFSGGVVLGLALQNYLKFDSTFVEQTTCYPSALLSFIDGIQRYCNRPVVITKAYYYYFSLP